MDGFWAVDTEGNIVDINEAYCRISGYSREELLHMNVRDIDLRESPEEIRSHIRKVMTEGSDRFETSHRARDGRTMPGHFAPDVLGAFKKLAPVFRDIRCEHCD